MRHAPTAEYASSSADLVYGVSADGRIVHIADVPSGSACGCRCPSCGADLVARKGPELAHHFGHKADQACHGAPETALHRLAKEIVEEELRLWLPEVAATYAGRVNLLHKASNISFTRAVSEARHLNEVVPDLFVERDDRLLLVEMFVTHRCDEFKIAELRGKGIATVEIDLSRVPRTACRDDVREAVLLKAPRTWVYHPKIEAAIAAMKEASAKKAEAERQNVERKVAAVAASYQEGLRLLAARPKPAFDRADEFFSAGLASHIGIDVGGLGCFSVHASEWQFTILRHAFIPAGDDPRAYRPKAILDWFKKRKLVRAAFEYVSPEMEAALIARDASFLSPYRAIEAYLNVLAERGVLRHTQSYYLAPEVMADIAEVRAERELRGSRLKDVSARVEKILAAVPAQEREELSVAEWMNLEQHAGISFDEAIHNDDPRFERMATQLARIEAMLFRKGPIVEDDLELPIDAERERQRSARKAEADAKEAARLTAERDAQARRYESLVSAAAALGADAKEWVEQANPALSGERPVDLARLSGAGLDRALHELERETQRRHAQRAREEAIEAFRDDLRSEVVGILGEAAKPFLASPYQELGRKRPVDYCVSRETLEQCLELARKVKKARR